jgi:hypothetical protein
MSIVTIEQNWVSGPIREHPHRTLEYLVTFIREVLKTCELDESDVVVVSVGCGNGVFEGLLKRRCPALHLIGVDPAPNVFNAVPPHVYNSDLCLQASFKDVSELTTATEKKIILLTFWPEVDNDYDMDALIRLDPIAFMVSYGPCGAAGSPLLFDTLNDQEFEPKPKVEFYVEGLRLGEKTHRTYDLVLKDMIVVGTGQGVSGKTMSTVGYCKVDKGRTCPMIVSVVAHRKMMGHECIIM